MMLLQTETAVLTFIIVIAVMLFCYRLRAVDCSISFNSNFQLNLKKNTEETSKRKANGKKIKRP